MSTSLLIRHSLALALSISALATTRASTHEPKEAGAALPEGHLLDSLLPVPDGIVWYGTWEDGMAEMERTGKPVMLHIGSPRERSTCVPGTW